MKNKLLVALALLTFGFNYAQEESKNRVNEVKVNFLNTIAIASVEIGYERFFGNDQSVGFEIFINDRFSYSPENDNKKFETNSFALSYNFYFSGKNNSSGYYLSPFFKYRFGDYVKNEDINGSIIKVPYDISSPIIGLGMGYKWLWNEKLTVGVGASLGRNFNKDVQDLFVAVEPNANISVGYRF
jgi:hypothetical protein